MSEAAEGQQKHCCFNLVERTGDVVSFRRVGKDETVAVAAKIIIDGDTEVATFQYCGEEYSLSANRYIPKVYSQNRDGRLEQKEDRFKDAHLHTSYNRGEIQVSDVCHCLFCETSFNATEVVDYIDAGETGLCPYCDCDSIIADASKIEMTGKLLSDLHMRFFN